MLAQYNASQHAVELESANKYERQLESSSILESATPESSFSIDGSATLRPCGAATSVSAVSTGPACCRRSHSKSFTIMGLCDTDCLIDRSID